MKNLMKLVHLLIGTGVGLVAAHLYTVIAPAVAVHVHIHEARLPDFIVGKEEDEPDYATGTSSAGPEPGLPWTH